MLDSENDSANEISDAVKTYLENLVSGLKTEIAGLRSLLEEKDERIATLEDGVVDAVQRNVALAAKVDELAEDMSVRLDDYEQYSRKDSLRIEGICYEKGESSRHVE